MVYVYPFQDVVGVRVGVCRASYIDEKVTSDPQFLIDISRTKNIPECVYQVYFAKYRWWGFKDASVDELFQFAKEKCVGQVFLVTTPSSSMVCNIVDGRLYIVDIHCFLQGTNANFVFERFMRHGVKDIVRYDCTRHTTTRLVKNVLKTYLGVIPSYTLYEKIPVCEKLATHLRMCSVSSPSTILYEKHKNHLLGIIAHFVSKKEMKTILGDFPRFLYGLRITSQ